MLFNWAWSVDFNRPKIKDCDFIGFHLKGGLMSLSKALPNLSESGRFFLGKDNIHIALAIIKRVYRKIEQTIARATPKGYAMIDVTDHFRHFAWITSFNRNRV